MGVTGSRGRDLERGEALINARHPPFPLLLLFYHPWIAIPVSEAKCMSELAEGRRRLVCGVSTGAWGWLDDSTKDLVWPRSGQLRREYGSFRKQLNFLMIPLLTPLLLFQLELFATVSSNFSSNIYNTPLNTPCFLLRESRFCLISLEIFFLQHQNPP